MIGSKINSKNYKLFLGATFMFFTGGGLCTNICNFNVRLKQTLLNEGFHRNLTYGILFETDDGKWLYEDCLIGLEQVLPAGVFSSPDELGDLRRNSKLNATAKNRVNIELTAQESSPYSVYVTGKVIGGKINLWLPVHARYHQAVAGGVIGIGCCRTARNEIAPPTLFLHCPDERLQVCGPRCKWEELPYTVLTDTLIWDVPVGNTDHYYMVATGTVTVVVFGSFYLLNTIHVYKVNALKKKL